MTRKSWNEPSYTSEKLISSENTITNTEMDISCWRLTLLRVSIFNSSRMYSPISPKRSKNLYSLTCFTLVSATLFISLYISLPMSQRLMKNNAAISANSPIKVRILPCINPSPTSRWKLYKGSKSAKANPMIAPQNAKGSRNHQNFSPSNSLQSWNQ